MKENIKTVIGLLVVFGGIGFMVLFSYTRLNAAFDIKYETEAEQNSLLKEIERSRNANVNQCDEIDDEAENTAVCIVEVKANSQQQSYEEIISNNINVLSDDYESQSRVGFSDGIYGENNFAKQYNVEGKLDPNTIYKYEMEFPSNRAHIYLSDDERTILYENYYDYELDEEEYATVLNPQASYKTLFESGVADEYNKGLLLGKYPEDKSNEVAVSVLVAQTICGELEACNQIDDVVDKEVTFNLGGILDDETISTITATAKISGIYIGRPGYNDIILAYDGLNTDDSNTSSDLSQEALIDQPITTTRVDWEEQKKEKEEEEQKEEEEREEEKKREEDEMYDNAYAIVSPREKLRSNAYNVITEDNLNAIEEGTYNDVSRTGFTDGIYGLNNFAEQYNVVGTIEEGVIYRYHIDLEQLDFAEYLTDEELNSLHDEFLSSNIVAESEYATLLNPQASYETLSNAKLLTGYERGIIAGSMPETGTNQLVLSYATAANICEYTSECTIIDELIDSEHTIKLIGENADGVKKSIQATVVISGIYEGQYGFNDILLAYDGLTDGDES